jgi:RNA polymerase sigma-70 factor (ECF subfamily)
MGKRENEMANPQARSNEEITEIYRRQVKTVYRVCFGYMKNPYDTEDAVQETFFKLIKSAPLFDGEEHEKAWLIRVATNVCKNKLTHWFRKIANVADYGHELKTEMAEIDETLEVIMGLPDRYKTAVYLYYYEGYTSSEIAKMLGKPSSTVRNHLYEARRILKDKLGGQFDEESEDH